jgi:hypothetical protein
MTDHSFDPSPLSGGQSITQIGDIGVTATHVITPAGTFPLKGTQWIVTDQSRTRTKIPTVAIVLAIVFIFFCFLSLLFLLMKEEVTEGYVQVTVSNPDAGLYHVASIRAESPETYDYAMRQVNWARSLAASL